MCTVIPCDIKSLSRITLSEPAFLGVLEGVTVCASKPTNKVCTEIDMSKATGDPVNHIYETLLTADPAVNNFTLKGSQYYVASLQANMKWCLMQHNRKICIYIIDEKFRRPEKWSYRYFWRYQARGHKVGLSMDHVGIITDETARICNVRF